MNFLSKHESGEFYLLGVSMLADGRYQVCGCYLWPDGSWRTHGVDIACATKQDALKECRRLLRVKKAKKGFSPTALDELPEKASEHLKVDLDRYVSHEEMWAIIRKSKRERYVEFDILTGLGDRFDAGIEYLSYVVMDEPELYDVMDNFGNSCRCHQSRFSRIEPTERAISLGVTSP